MAFTVKLSSLATQHIEEAYSWIKETNPSALDEWFNGITNALQSLKNLPYRCSRIPETDEFNQEIRQLIEPKNISRKSKHQRDGKNPEISQTNK
jgi:plasmid stabilization system protein ParE